MPSAAEAGKLGGGSFQGIFRLSSVIYKLDPALYGPLVGHPETQRPAQLDFCSQCCWGRKGSPSKHVTHLVPTKASCATRGLAGGLSGNCVGGSNGQDMTFAIRSGTDLPTSFIGTFGAIYAGHVFKYVADLEPRSSYVLH